MNFVLIGGAGFLGYHLAKEIRSRGFDLVIVDNFSNSEMDRDLWGIINESKIQFVELDATKPELESYLSSESIVLNLAALNGTELFYSKPFDVLYKTSLSALEIPSMCSRVGVKAYYYFGSSESYAGAINLGIAQIPTIEGVPLVLDRPDKVRWSYATAKILGEVATFGIKHQYGIPVGVFRLHNIYGPRMKTSHVIPDLIDKFKKGHLQVLNCSHTRSFMYVDDAVKAIFKIVDSGVLLGMDFPIVNIGSDEEVSIRELAIRIKHLLGIKEQFICVQGHEGSVERRVPNLQLMRELYESKLTSLNEGLAKTIHANLEDIHESF